MKKISVVVPLYNSEQSIENTLDGILNQTYPIDEVIVVDDGSTDKSLEVVSNYVKQNDLSNVVKVISKSNQGVSHTRNAGIKYAKNEYISTCDSDDVWSSDKIEKEMEVFAKNPDASLVGSRVSSKKISAFYFIKFGEIVRITHKMQLFKNFFSPSAIIFRKSKMLEILPDLFPENQRYAEEGLVFLFMTKYLNCYLLNEKNVKFGDDKPMFGFSGLSSNLKEMHKGELRNFKAIYHDGGINPILYLIALVYSYLKYYRRVLIVFLR